MFFLFYLAIIFEKLTSITDLTKSKSSAAKNCEPQIGASPRFFFFFFFAISL